MQFTTPELASDPIDCSGYVERYQEESAPE
jgi:hypothetical protein